MIRDEQLEKAADIDVAHPDENVMVRAAYIKEMAQELLAYREAERKTKSWDDTEAWVQTRSKVTEFYDNTGHLRGKFYGEPEKRPK